VGGPPLGRGPELRFEDLHDLALGGKPVEACLAEHFLIVDVYLEPAPAPGLQLEAAQHRRPAIEQLLSQAHGLGQVVSRDAKFDRDLRFGARHLWALTCSYTSRQGAIPR